MASNEIDMSALAGAAGMGAVAGLRAMSAPALLSQAVRTGSIELADGPCAFLGTPEGANLATGLAALEMVGDKISSAPDRTSAFPLASRAVSGAIVGAAVCCARKKEWGAGALVGALAAVGAAYAGLALRRVLTKNLGLPNVLAGLVEDAIVVGCSVAILRREADARPFEA